MKKSLSKQIFILVNVALSFVVILTLVATIVNARNWWLFIGDCILIVITNLATRYLVRKEEIHLIEQDKKLIKNCTETMEQLQQGNFDAKVKIVEDCSEELSKLVVAISSMTEKNTHILLDLQHLFQHLGNCNLCVESNCPDEYDGNYAILYENILEMIRNVTDFVNQMLEQANLVGECTEQITCSSNQIASATEELTAETSTLQESTCTINETIQQNAKYMENIDLACQNTGTKITYCETEMQKLVKFINEMFAEIKNILNIFEIFKEIQGQINLLSLNARIEAANAGKTGQGFSVVATELNTLSEGTTSQLTQINDTIEKLVNLIETTKKVTGGVSNVIGEIQKEASTIVTSTDSVTEAIEEQATRAKEITDSISNLSAASEELTANIQETKSSIETDKELITELYELLKKFNTKK